ncbi:MAG TPA: hypothetical protein VGW78_07290 [Candidatus Babeliales bacterium]|jgi:hypothetical protein|nr:hypothetical protein [Candidatus Babeliales bacterium]
MNKKQRKTLGLIFKVPVPSDVGLIQKILLIKVRLYQCVNS